LSVAGKSVGTGAQVVPASALVKSRDAAV